MSKKDEWTIRCSGHNYITLEWNEKFIFCLDNDMMYAEEMIYKIEKRTGVDFRNIKIKGQKEDFTGLRFFNGGWKRDFWGNFPSKDEIEAYIKLKNGKKNGSWSFICDSQKRNKTSALFIAYFYFDFSY